MNVEALVLESSRAQCRRGESQVYKTEGGEGDNPPLKRSWMKNMDSSMCYYNFTPSYPASLLVMIDDLFSYKNIPTEQVGQPHTYLYDLKILN